MKVITYTEFMDRNFDTKGISNYELVSTCQKCQVEYRYKIKVFMQSRLKYSKDTWNSCQKCFVRYNLYENPDWIKRNSEAQLIAQNKPEQKLKNAIGVSKSWTSERKAKASAYLKNRLENDPVFRAKADQNIGWKHYKNAQFYINMQKSIGIGGLKGRYNNIRYDSALELSFILWCEHQSIPIKNYDLEPLKYLDEHGVERMYFPDFIINDNDIIEIKGTGLYYQKNYERNICKIESAKRYFSSYQVLFNSDECLKKFYKTARKWHHENKKQENN